MLRKPFQVLLICCAVLGAYYSAMFAEVSILDDQDMINGLLNTQTFDIKGLFLPRSAGGGYYRPLIGLSYLIDRFAWFAQAEIMHFENVLLHLINSLLVYATGRTLFIRDGRERYFPLVAALLFGLHPLTTESVYWISGRTDLLAGVCVLLAALLVARTVRGAAPLFLAPAFFLTLIGATAKETALAFIPGMFMIWWGGVSERDDAEVDNCGSKRRIILVTACAALAVAVGITTVNFWLVVVIAAGAMVAFVYLSPPEHSGVRSWRPALVLGGMGLLGVLAFWTMRQIAFSSDISRIGQTVQLMLTDTSYTIQLFLGAAAFYVGKFFMPLPLNAAIRDIDPLYSLAGIALLVFCLYLLSRPSLFSGLVLTGFFMIVPALPLVFGTVAWTAYAERYVYLALPFWILSVGCLIPEVSDSRQRLRTVVTCVLLVVMGLCVIQRGQVWATNIALCADMVAKSPDFKKARGLYMSALLHAGRYRDVEEQYRIASRLPSIRYEEQYELVMASVYQRQGRDSEAERMLLSAFEKSKGKKPGVIQALVSFYEGKSKTADPEQRKKYDQLVLGYTRKLYALDKEPHTLYRLAKIHLRLNEKSAAVAALQEVVQRLPASDPERAAAEKLLSRQ